MSNPHELNSRLATKLDSIDGQTLQRTQSHRREFEKTRNFFVYDLAEGDYLQIFLDGTTPEGIQIEEDRSLFGKMTNHQSGLVIIMADSHRETSWTGRDVNFGTTLVAGGILTTGGLLRGMIIPGSNMTVDLGGKHFFGEGSEVTIVPSIYSGLAVNGVSFFDLKSESGQA